MSDLFKTVFSNPLFFLFFLWLCWPKKGSPERIISFVLLIVGTFFYAFGYITKNYAIVLSVYFLVPLLRMMFQKAE